MGKYFPNLVKVSSDKRTLFFLLFLFLANIGQFFIDRAFQFTAFDLTESKSVVSLVGSISGVAFITVGLFSGIIVDAFSRYFFAVFHLLTFTVLSLIFYFIYENGLASVYLLFGFILLHEISSSFSKSAQATIFYDLCGGENLSQWISWRGIVLNLASISSLMLLIFFVDAKSFFFVIYGITLMSTYLIFLTIDYRDCNQRQNFKSFLQAMHFFVSSFRAFMTICYKQKTLFFVYIFSFIKTIFIFWPMFSGALLKFGISDNETRRQYLMVVILMNLVSMVSLYMLGHKKHFTIRTFVIGCAISGLGIALFGMVEGFVLNVITLAIMYLGLTISQLAYSYILRIELPEKHRTQGLGFSIAPYYLADIFSGIIFASLLLRFSTTDLLIAAGVSLMTVCVVTLPFVKAKT